MTRLAVLADIHANLPALQAVIADMRQFAADQVIVAGDSVNWGPHSREVLQLIIENRWAVIRGNNALYALDHDTPRAPRYWAVFTLPPLLREELGEDGLRALASMPDSLSLRFPDSAPLYMTHGIPGDPWTAVYPHSPQREVMSWLAPVSENTVVCAHSHIALERHVGLWHIFNPGSVGVPLDGEKSASYIVIDGDYDGWRLHAHRRVKYNMQPLFAAFERKRFAQRGGVTASLVIEEFRSARLQVHPYIMWKRAHHPNAPDTPALLDEFLALPDASPYLPPGYLDATPALYRV